MPLEFNIFQKGSKDTVLLAQIGTGEALPDNMVNLSQDSELVPENFQDIATFKKIEISGELSKLSIDFESFYSLSTTVYNRYLFTPFAIFESETSTNPIQVEPLFYKYELKFDHRSSASNPGGNLFVLDNNGNIIPRFYYSLFVEPSYRIVSETAAAAQLGVFLIESSQVDASRARAALGENLWGEEFYTTGLRERYLWEQANTELLRPKWNTNDLEISEASGTWSRLDDGRYTREEFLAFYVDHDGFWGQAVDANGQVIYTARNGATINRGFAISGSLDLLPQQIGSVISDKYLDGDNLFLPDVPLRITILLPEFMVHQDNQTFWVQYNKYINYPLSGEMVEEYIPNFREIINPTLFMKEGLDYTLNYTTKYVSIATDFESRWGQYDSFHIKKNNDHRIRVKSPIGGMRDGWFLSVTKGDFKVGNQIYETHRFVDSIAKTRDWYVTSGPPFTPCLSENGLYLGTVLKERATIVDHRTIQVSKTPLYFWSGPRTTTRDSIYGYFPDETESAGFDTGEFPGADNPWPRYLPPYLIDWHYRSEYSFYPSNPAADPSYSHGITIYKNGTRVSNSIIDTWDFWNGLIVFNDRIHPDDVIEVSYLYEQDKAPLGFLNLNPIYPEKLYDPSSPNFIYFE